VRSRPLGHELLAIAATTLREEILPTLRDDKKYLALMIVNAVSVAERQQRAGERPLHVEAAELERALDVESGESDVQTRVAELSRELARRVREGCCDDDVAIQRVLWTITVARVRESAPRALELEGVV
jgi:hypothetical protein